jgi:cytochrome c
MSSLELNKIVAAILTAGVIAWTAIFITELLYHPEFLEENVYKIEVAGTTDVAVVEEAPAALEPIGPLLAAADPEEGQKLLKKCTACHSFDSGGPNKVGPNLWNIVNKPIASADGFGYSASLEGMADKTWTYENLNGFLHKPKQWAEGTKMGFAGISKPEQRADLIAYLRGLSDSPAPLPE